MSRVGFFAGAFDPIHNGHVSVARNALEVLKLDTVYFMVENSPWSEKQPISIVHRKNMVQLAIADEEQLLLLDIDDVQFSVLSTLPKIKEMFPKTELFFIFGADVFLAMNSSSWQGLAELLRNQIVVFERLDKDENSITDHADELGVKPVVISSEYPDHKSTEVRHMPSKRRLWIPDRVAEYIGNNALY